MRVDYYDIAKGILIIVVVLGHALYYVENAGVTHYGYDVFYTVYCCFYIFYMQAFFLINGMTAGFDKPFKSFLKSKILTLMLPCLVFSLVINFCDGQYPLNMELLHILVKHGGRGTYMWFLPALFLANIVFWFVNRYLRRNYIKAVAVIMLAVMGGTLNEMFPNRNIWYCYQSFILLPFLWIGCFLREYKLSGNKIIELIGIGTFLTIMVIGNIFNLKFPYLCLGINVTATTLLLHLVLATSGSLTILALSRKIGHCKVLQSLGKGSLVIYMTHIVVICGLLSLTAEYWKDVNSNFLGGLLFVVLMIVSMIISYSLNWLFNQRYLRILLGRV